MNRQAKAKIIKGIRDCTSLESRPKKQVTSDKQFPHQENESISNKLSFYVENNNNNPRAKYDGFKQISQDTTTLTRSCVH